jgi:hypothetical protein
MRLFKTRVRLPMQRRVEKFEEFAGNKKGNDYWYDNGEDGYLTRKKVKKSQKVKNQ